MRESCKRRLWLLHHNARHYPHPPDHGRHEIILTKTTRFQFNCGVPAPAGRAHVVLKDKQDPLLWICIISRDICLCIHTKFWAEFRKRSHEFCLIHSTNISGIMRSQRRDPVVLQDDMCFRPAGAGTPHWIESRRLVKMISVSSMIWRCG